ncbi:MAG: ATP-binding domain-containing protein [Blastocatellia bacterium]|nr:ATP-binding domain-containing protein [Blastocatellia bacterium]
MDLTSESRQHIESVASETLELFEKVAKAAKSKLRTTREPEATVFANVNTMTSGPAMQQLQQIIQADKDSYSVLKGEPAIARVVVEEKEGLQRTYYICRVTPVSDCPNLASYRSPIGRLASLPVGSEFALPNGTIVEVLEQAKLHPSLRGDYWDSRDTVVEADDFGPITIESLRALLRRVDETSRPYENLLEPLLTEESLKANIIEGVRRGVITKMGLRDQPVLDQYQDEIFRLPLNKRLLILGPPGTGKTTTLIRRLGQKLDTEFLDEDEQRLVEKIREMNGADHSSSWVMFTPTELLKQYLKEAFAREGVPASDLRIRTWHDYQRELARNKFGVLRTVSGGGTFVLKESIPSLSAEAMDRPIQWFSDFDEWQRAVFVKELHEAAQALSQEQAPEVRGLGQRLTAILDRAVEASLVSIFEALAAEVINAQRLLSGLKDAIDSRIRNEFNLQLNRNSAFLDEIARFIDGLPQSQVAEAEEQDDLETEEEEEISVPRTGRTAAINAYMQAARAQSRAHVSGQMLSITSRNGRIIEWLGDRTLSEADQGEIGEKLLIQNRARRFVNPVKRYTAGIPKRYRSFRRLRQEEGKWYSENKIESKDIHPLELDIVLLAILRTSGSLLSRQNVLRDIDSPAWASLKPILELYKNQVLVDEAPDFSPVQLACMAALAHPHIRSFFVCGDFNQRLTTWGTRSEEDLNWVLPDIEKREITFTYRQSGQLNEMARAMITAVGGSIQEIRLPIRVDSEGFSAVLLESASQQATIVNWLADRICEIERFVRQLPSTAILVNSEDEVAPLARELNTALTEHNIKVVPCPQGQVMGQDHDVRVFDVQHIKGLEFEAVFFIGIDRLAGMQPELFDKYLYVGTTRAATYLGITCENVLPAPIESLRQMFVPDWKNPLRS